ncbi:MAG: hypothetical protein L6Q98_13815 [Anaerolineae bacterium]|nr:hypothetical protein [Anaerolineae bacterium]NUQ05595.1 hypothetical protein [Anaerolineae bacterium]
MINPSGSPPTSDALLQPRTVIELVQRTFAIYRDHLPAFLLLAAVVFIPVTVVTALFGNSLVGAISFVGETPTLDPSVAGQICMYALIVMVLTVVQTAIFTCVSTYITSEAQFGRKLTLGQAWNESSPLISRLVIGYLIFYLAIFTITLVITVASALCPLLIALLALNIYLSIVINALLGPVILLERSGSSAAILRSYVLGKSAFWRVFGMMMLVVLITFLIQSAIDLVAALAVPTGSAASGSPWIDALVSMVISIVTAPIAPVAMTLLYYDIRVRGENLAPALQQIGGGARPHQVAVPPNPPQLVSSQDWGNIAALVGIVLVMMLLLSGVAFTFFNLLVPGMGGLPSGF